MKKNNRKKRDITTTLFILSCTIIPLVQWLILYVYTNFSSFFMAFTNKNGEITLDNFVRFFSEFSMPTSNMSTALVNTLITFSLLFISYPFQVRVSYFLYKQVPGPRFYRIAFFLPSIIFSVAIAMVYRRMLDTSGIIAQTVGECLKLGYTPEILADSRFANFAVLFQMMWLQFPGDMVIWGGTFARIPEEVLESGRIDGVNWWQEFTRIIVPLLWPTVALQMILLFCGIFGASGEVFLLTEGQYGTINLNTWIYLQLFKHSGNNYTSNVYNYMSAAGMVMTVIAIILSIVVRKFTDKAFQDVEF